MKGHKEDGVFHPHSNKQSVVNASDVHEDKTKVKKKSHQDLRDEHFEKFHDMQKGQVRLNRINGLKEQFKYLTDANQHKFKKMLNGKSLDDLTAIEARHYHMVIGAMERDDKKILTHYHELKNRS